MTTWVQTHRRRYVLLVPVSRKKLLFCVCAWRLDGRTLDDRYEGGWVLQEIKVCRADTPLQGLNKLPHLWNISEREAEHFLVVKAYKRQKSIFRSDHTHADGTCSTLNRRRWKKWIRLRSCAGFDGTRRQNQNKPFMEAENRVFFRIDRAPASALHPPHSSNCAISHYGASNGSAVPTYDIDEKSRRGVIRTVTVMDCSRGNSRPNVGLN